MDDLLLREARHLDGNVGAVGADVAADLADGGAAQAAARAVGGHVDADVALARHDGVELVGADVLLGIGVEVNAGQVTGDGLRVGDGLHEGGRPAAAVAGGPDVVHAGGGAGRAAATVNLDARALVEPALDLLAHGADHGRGRNVHGVARGLGTATARLVRLAEAHDLAGQLAVCHADRGEKLAELHTLLKGELQLLLVRRHLLLGAAVDDAHVLHALGALGHARGVHGGVAGAHDHDVGAQLHGLAGLGGLEELQDVDLLAGLEAHLAGRPRARGHHDVGEALVKELLDARDLAAHLDLRAKGEAEGHVLVDVVVGDAELGDDVARHAAELVRALDDGDLGAGAREEERGGKASRAATHDRHVLIGRRGEARRTSGTELLHDLVEAAAGSLELGLADARALGLVEAALALGAAGVRAEVAGDVRQGVALHDDLERLGELALVHAGEVGRDVLLDGAAGAARRREAAHERELGVDLVRLGRLDGLLVVLAGGHAGRELGHGVNVHVVQALGAGEKTGDLEEALVAAGLEDVGGHGDRPDAGRVELADVAGVGAAGVGDAQAAVELAGDAARELDREREERAAGHVHLLARQLAAGHVHRERVGELDAKREALLGAELDEALEHGHGVDPLQVLAEVRVVEDDVVKAQLVQALAREVVAQERGVALDVGVHALLGDEVGGDALDLVGRAAVERGLGDGVGDLRGDGVDEVCVHVLEAVEVGEGPVAALGPDLGAGGVLHALDVGVDLGALDALEAVAHGHVEDEAVGVAEAVLAGDELAGPPGLDVLGEGVGHRELGGPLAVVALVLGHDAGLVHAGGELLAVHDLDGLELEEARARHVGGHDVLRELGVGAGGRAKGGLDLLGKDRLGAALVDVGLAHAEDAGLRVVLGQDPVHDLRERDRPHDVTHCCSSPADETLGTGSFVSSPDFLTAGNG